MDITMQITAWLWQSVVRSSNFPFEMDELSAVWYSGFQWNYTAQTQRQTKAAVAVIVLILCGFLMLVIGFVEENSQMRTGGFTMFGVGFLILVCLCCLSYLKDRWSQEGRTRRNESPLTGRVERDAECFELILNDRRSINDEANTSASRWDISSLLSRILGSPPTYEEVATNADFRDTTTRTSLPPPPYYTADVSEGDVDEISPPSYESSQRLEASQLSRTAVSGLRPYSLGAGCYNERQWKLKS